MNREFETVLLDPTPEQMQADLLPLAFVVEIDAQVARQMGPTENPDVGSPFHVGADVVVRAFASLLADHSVIPSRAVPVFVALAASPGDDTFDVDARLGRAVGAMYDDVQAMSDDIHRLTRWVQNPEVVEVMSDDSREWIFEMVASYWSQEDEGK